jgi:hypothetical protein
MFMVRLAFDGARAVKSQKTLAAIRRIYDSAQTALWAIACALALYTTFVVLPHVCLS